LRAIGQEGAAVIGRGTTRMTASGLGRVVQLTNLTDSTQPSSDLRIFKFGCAATVMAMTPN